MTDEERSEAGMPVTDDWQLPTRSGSITRRRALQLMGIGGAVTLAGCIGGGGGGGPCRDLRIDLSTGTTNFTKDSFGTTDTDWEVVSSPDGTTGQAISVQPVGQWVTLTTANWIEPYGTGGWPAPVDPLGEYVYENDFEVPDTWEEGQCQLRIANWSVDDAATLELDGPNGTTVLDQDSGHTTLKGPVTAPVGPGQYTLRAIVDNNATVTGLLIHAEVFCDCDLPVDDPCDLSIEKEFIGDTVTHGGIAEFQITVCNDGDGTCEDPVTVTDDLPPGTWLASHGGSGWTCTESGGVVTCEHPNSGGLGAGDCLPPVTMTLDVGSPDEVGKTLRNCATVEQGDTDLAYKTDCVKVPVEPLPGECDLAITKSHDGSLVPPGDTTVFEIDVCNVGDGHCDGLVSVVDALPSNLTYVSASGSGWTCTESGGTVTCDHSNTGGLAPGDCLPTLTLEVELGSADEVGDAVRNCVRLDYEDVDGTNDLDCATVPVDTDPNERKCDLAVRKTHDGETVVEGSGTTFEIEVCNVGSDACDGPVTVVDDLSSGVNFDAASGNGWSVTQSGSSIVFTHGNAGGLAPGDCLPVVSLDVTVGPMEETGDAVKNCARIKGEDSNPANDEDCVTVPVEPRKGECDLRVSKRVDGDVVYANGTATFEVEVCNAGDGLCNGPVTVIDDLPAGVSFDAASGNGWSVTQSGNSLVCTHPATGGLASGDCLPVLSIQVSVGSMDETGDQLRNCVRIEGEDVNPENDADCVTVPVEPPQGKCDLEVTKTHPDGDSVEAGSQTTFEIEVCNVGDGPCNDPVKVFDDLPAGVSFDAASGAGWTVTQSGTSLVLTHQNGGGLAPGDCLPVATLSVNVGDIGETGDRITNCAKIQSEDGNPENDSDCVTVTVTQPASSCDGLEVDKTVPSQFYYGQQGTYEIDVCNNTTQTCNGQIEVTDDVPDGMSFVSASGSGWTASVNNGVVTATNANNGGLAPGDCLTLTLTVDVAPANQFPGGSDAVQNCAQLYVDGGSSVVDQACVLHVIHN